MLTWKALVALAIVVAGAVTAFSVYTFEWRESGSDREAQTTFIDTETGRHRLFRIHSGDVIRISATATQCEASHEAGIPNLFCTRVGSRGRYQVVFWNDSVDIYDLALHGEPMVPTFSVPARVKGK